MRSVLCMIYVSNEQVFDLVYFLYLKPINLHGLFNAKTISVEGQ